VILGSDCTYWDEHRAAFCGAPATWVRDSDEDGSVRDVLCDAHRTRDSKPISSFQARAPRSEFWQSRDSAPAPAQARSRSR